MELGTGMAPPGTACLAVSCIKCPTDAYLYPFTVAPEKAGSVAALSATRRWKKVSSLAASSRCSRHSRAPRHTIAPSEPGLIWLRRSAVQCSSARGPEQRAVRCMQPGCPVSCLGQRHGGDVRSRARHLPPHRRAPRCEAPIQMRDQYGGTPSRHHSPMLRIARSRAKQVMRRTRPFL